MVFRRFIESWTTLTGSVKSDATFLSGRIARRCLVALELSAEEGFRSMGAQALSMRTRIEESECLSAERRLIRDALIQLEKDAALLEIKHNLRNKVSEVLRNESLPKQLFIEGRERGLSFKEYGHMAVRLSLPLARMMVANIVALPHEKDDTSLIYQISKRQDIVVLHFMAMGAATYLAYVEMFIGIPEDQKGAIGIGIKEAFGAFRENAELLFALSATYFRTILFDLKVGGAAHYAGTDTHRTLVKLLSQAYSEREDIDDLEGLDSLTLAPFTDNYYLTIIKDIRDTAQLRFAHK